MSEHLNTREAGKNFRLQLLATASAMALIGFSIGTSDARAADGDNDHPAVWIALGGQLSQLDEGQETFVPIFPKSPQRPSIFSPSQGFERPPLYSLDETGMVSFEPDGSDWVFSASVRYGHSVSKKDINQQTNPEPTHFHYSSGGVPKTVTLYSGRPDAARFADTSVQNGEHHLTLDFQAGKDVGLGMFGGGSGSSVFSLGVRFAQFSDTSNIALKSDPDWRRFYKYVNYPSAGIHNEKLVNGQLYHSNAASLHAARSFHGVGPSLSWNASAPFAGSSKSGELLFDWGVNAAVLFGRQKAHVHHQATAQYRPNVKYAHRYVVSHYSADPPARSRFVTVPNVGGFAGLTFRVENFKVSAGYRADFFFGAMDGGVDTVKNENQGFYGPFASLSVGFL
ncbi:MAG TPA: hypothetical protein VIJ62_06120 [Rhizomicrobium sp.]